MSVTVDRELLPAETLGLRTVGQVLAHIKKENRLVVHVLIDGQEPDLKRLGHVRQSPLLGHTVYIETAEPRRMALDVLAEIESQLDEADRLKIEAAEQLQGNNTVKAMEKLSGCLTTWQHAQQSLSGAAQLMGADLNQVNACGRPLSDVMNEFSEQLKQIKSSLESRDYVTLSDLLMYETTETTSHWRSAMEALRKMID